MLVLDPHFKAMIDAEAAAAPPDAPSIETLPPEMVRAGYRMQRTSQNTKAPTNLTTLDLQVAGGEGPIGARLYTPEGVAAPGPGLVYFHGGGWVIGDLDTHDGHCRRLASLAGVRVLAIDYRLAPEHPFPAPYDDALAATKWAFDHAAEIGFDKARVAVGGCSAGGNLAASVAQELRGEAAYPVAFQLLLYPALWPHEETESRKAQDGPLLTRAVMAWFEKTLNALGHPHEHRATPARTKDLKGLPPALVVTAGFDMLRDEGRDYAAALNAAGVKAEHIDYPSLPHDFFIMGDVSPAVDAAAAETAAKLKAALG